MDRFPFPYSKEKLRRHREQELKEVMSCSSCSHPLTLNRLGLGSTNERAPMSPPPSQGGTSPTTRELGLANVFLASAYNGHLHLDHWMGSVIVPSNPVSGWKSWRFVFPSLGIRVRIQKIRRFKVKLSVFFWKRSDYIEGSSSCGFLLSLEWCICYEHIVQCRWNTYILGVCFEL